MSLISRLFDIFKSIRARAFLSRSAVMAILGVALVVALFFLPELISYRYPSTSDDRKRSAAVKSAVNSRVAPNLASDDQKSKSPIDRVVNFFSSRTNRSLESDYENSSEKTINRSEQDAFIASLTWEQLLSDQSRKSLEGAIKSANDLILILSDDQRIARFALQNFINGARSVMAKGEKKITPQSAFRYLEHLDLEVASALIRSKATREQYNLWARVGLGALFATRNLQAIKQRAFIPFDPKITLTWVELYLRPADLLNLNRSNINMRVNIHGFARGSDIVSPLELFINDRKISEINLLAPSPNGRRSFYIGANQVQIGNWTLKARSNIGEIFSQTYSFLPRANSYYDFSSGNFNLPFNRPSEFYYDRRIDRLFKVSARLSAPPSLMMDNRGNAEVEF
ncbi:MAG TPA: hypothetical protein PKD37_03805 [Oligoflexia bacterium]|nr:hypothetical protein [Oligoflexia bacterium]HMP27092.1 hypothetical protein [Oligoflexia bacterium]